MMCLLLNTFLKIFFNVFTLNTWGGGGVIQDQKTRESYVIGSSVVMSYE